MENNTLMNLLLILTLACSIVAIVLTLRQERAISDLDKEVYDKIGTSKSPWALGVLLVLTLITLSLSIDQAKTLKAIGKKQEANLEESLEEEFNFGFSNLKNLEPIPAIKTDEESSPEALYDTAYQEIKEEFDGEVDDIINNTDLTPLEKKQKIEEINAKETDRIITARLEIKDPEENIINQTLLNKVGALSMSLDCNTLSRRVRFDKKPRNLKTYPTYKDLQNNTLFTEMVKDLEDQGIVVEYIQEVPEEFLEKLDQNVFLYSSRLMSEIERFGKDEFINAEIDPDGVVHGIITTWASDESPVEETSENPVEE